VSTLNLVVYTGLTGYSPISSIEEMKNALYFRGDVSTAVDDDPMQSENITGFDVTRPESKTDIKWPLDDIALAGNANLGKGSSFASQELNHAVVIVGWGPCQVKNVSASLDASTP